MSIEVQATSDEPQSTKEEECPFISMFTIEQLLQQARDGKTCETCEAKLIHRGQIGTGSGGFVKKDLIIFTCPRTDLTVTAMQPIK